MKAQLENGYSRVANQLLERLAQLPLPPAQFRVAISIIRHTYGFGKKERDLSNGFLADSTGMSRENVIRALRGLVAGGVVSKRTLGGRNLLGISTETARWKVVSGRTPPLVSKRTPNKERSTKERRTKTSRPKSPRKPPPREAVDAAELLAELILKHTPEHTKLNTDAKRTETCNRWAYDLDKLHRIDGLTWNQVAVLIKWTQADEFWRSNILSGSKLRDKANQLIARMRANGGGQHFKAEQKMNPEQLEQLQQLIALREKNGLDVTQLRARLERER